MLPDRNLWIELMAVKNNIQLLYDECVEPRECRVRMTKLRVSIRELLLFLALWSSIPNP